MSSLRKLTKPVGTVTLADGQKFTVNGLSPSHIFGLYHRHPGELAALFSKYSEDGELTPEDTQPVAKTLVSMAPLLMAEIIALGTGGDPFDDRPLDLDTPEGATVWQGDVALAAELTMPVQIDALQKIGDLTFTAEMPPKKFFGVLRKMLQSARETVSPSQTTSMQ